MSEYEATVVDARADHEKVTLKVWVDDEVGRHVCHAWLDIPRKTAQNMVRWIDAEIEAVAQKGLFELEVVTEPERGDQRFRPRLT